MNVGLQQIEDFPLEDFDPSQVQYDLTDELTPERIEVVLQRVLKGFINDRLPNQSSSSIA